MSPALTVVIHPSLRASRPEIEYVLRTLATIAGYSIEVSCADRPAGTVDVYYGPAVAGLAPTVWLPSCGRPLTDAPSLTANALSATNRGVRFSLHGAPVDAHGLDAPVVYEDDVVMGSYWLLTGARESTYPRSKVDDLDLAGSPLIRDGALDVPVVSIWGRELRRHFQARGLPPLDPPWAADGRAAFAFTHDVDYPEIIPWIEAPRQALRGHAGMAMRILTGRTHYWTFDEWIALEQELGARPCFYFMARQGSLLQYAMGTPDDFYDIGSARFRQLFARLRDTGAEIGLHASFHAHRSAAVLREEMLRLEEASGSPVRGNRHHYWHLDPNDPNTTLARHAEAGLDYDSSLGLEYYPGFRRGICHPFRPFHPATRRTIDTVQLPPTWMDDHFDRRLEKNGITDPDDVSRRLVGAAASAGGIVVVDYHSRGMNREVYPRWGAWLERFARTELAGRVNFYQPHEIASIYRRYEQQLGHFGGNQRAS